MSDRLNRWTSRGFFTLSFVALSISAWAQPTPSTARESVVRQGAPEIVLPSHAAEGEREGPLRQTRFLDATLRGAVGQVPGVAGECRISEGRHQTFVTYNEGLPIRISKRDSGVREEAQQLRWNAERVLLERVSWTLNILQPATRRTPERWEAQNWSVETTTWDDYGRPLERSFTHAGGETSSYRCSWLGFRAGSCQFSGPLDADITLTPRGEIDTVQWRQRGTEVSRGSLQAEWSADTLLNVEMLRGVEKSAEQYRYNSQGELLRFRRTIQLPRGERVVTWVLTRDEDRNVTRVVRRCEGPCEGMRGTVTFRVDYDEGFTNTFCGAWWDDAVEPTLRGW